MELGESGSWEAAQRRGGKCMPFVIHRGGSGGRNGCQAYHMTGSVREAFGRGKNKGSFVKAGYWYKHLGPTLGCTIWLQGVEEWGREASLSESAWG